MDVTFSTFRYISATSLFFFLFLIVVNLMMFYSIVIRLPFYIWMHVFLCVSVCVCSKWRHFVNNNIHRTHIDGGLFADCLCDGQCEILFKKKFCLLHSCSSHSRTFLLSAEKNNIFLRLLFSISPSIQTSFCVREYAKVICVYFILNLPTDA